jgi:hypothetical protein
MPLFSSKFPSLFPKKPSAPRHRLKSSRRQVVTQTTPTKSVETRSSRSIRSPDEDDGGQPSDGPFDRSVLIVRITKILNERSGNIWLSEFRDYFLDFLSSTNMSPGSDDGELKKAIRDLEEGIRSWVRKYEKSSSAVAAEDFISVTDDYSPYNLTISPIWKDPNSFSCQCLEHLFLNCLMCKEFEDRGKALTSGTPVQASV